METVLHALKAMGKANSVELAARLDISREEVLNELWELKKNGVVDKTGHTWFLAVEGESGVTEGQALQPEAPDAVTEEVAPKVTADMMIEFIAQKGATTCEELADKFGVTTRKVASTLAVVTATGRLVRVSIKGRFHYKKPDVENGDLSASSSQDEQSHHEAENSAAGDEMNRFPLASESTAKASTDEFIREVPSFTEKSASSVMLPPLHAASRELRRAKKQVQKWERVCAALRELNKHREIVMQITDSSSSIASEK
ncbi:DUF1627 domain-containing protein [Escherichia coli]|uniref:DUF1627 domain-containing protein n=1 Tax=Escherichia coli TaxID=562 RepID=A0A3T9KVU0_ECOLX|nr:DUF1627 domain-containing protein [Escherichia coli]EFW8106426.1 DUF1627 domain-containing protein [Shigella sonnei]EIG6219600.1 DUF1627 domain-containing protein [Shigella dysenteriae]EIH4992205.1 DUF1627 domain-containing protein [Shigella boydii]HDL6814524.1 DUF1627 domain-containing protein [Escherichia coli 371_08]HDL6818931.1 DUF1627 domain-containing protein [Escherichia coli 290_10]HDL6833421.1 DUF1627 domain-containing protein [Escherichia coli 229_11]HDL7561702.1 DUF1627 domain-